MTTRDSIVLMIFLMFWVVVPVCSKAQDTQSGIPVYNDMARVRDSITATRVPFLPFPGQYRNRLLPPFADNSLNIHWPGIRDQQMFYSCQQNASVGYIFTYEINRLRNQSGSAIENKYPPHYTWNFMNKGDRYTGVHFTQSFEAIKQQGHMTSDDYGSDTAMSYLGWITGYDKYYRGMRNHVKQVYAIQVNNLEGINQLRNYLYDHLDGSTTGGIACFTTSSGSLYSMPILPPGTPEAGKNVILSWWPEPVHGMAIVGYNDSIRIDVNKDGQFTNNLDINGDGVTDVRDWEIGGFKIANTYGAWWSNDGYVYALYSSFAKDFPYGGIWNNRVYVLDADTGYSPKLTVKVNLSYNLRDRIRILAGISRDTAQQMPDHVIDFPVFNFQGGENVMQGLESLPDAGNIEFGLDVTPLLNFVQSGQPARYFFMVEEQDPDQSGSGTIHHVSFINYGNGAHEFPVNESDLPIVDNGLTVASVVASFIRTDVQIATNTLPPFTAGQQYQVQLAATGGKAPYSWSLVEDYTRQPSGIPMPPITGSNLQVHKEYQSFFPVAMPFAFPFYGKLYDTIYVNHFGFIAFEPQFLPEPYLTDEMNMLETFALISPAFSQNYNYQSNLNDGIWFHADANQASIRWRISVAPYYTSSTNDFALVLYPDGKFAFRYGDMDNRNFRQKAFCGVSKGDGKNFNLNIQWDVNELADLSWLFYPSNIPRGLNLSEGGLLTISQADSTQIYGLNVRASDAGKIEDTKVLYLSDGLIIDQQLVSAGGEYLKPGVPASVTLLLTNNTPGSIINLKLNLRSGDSLVQISDSVQIVETIQSGQTLTIPNAFSLTPSGNLFNDYPVMMNIVAQTGAKSWDRPLCYRVAAPVIVLETPSIDDGDDNLLNPGEVADLVVFVRNSGWLSGSDLRLELLLPDTGISLLSPSLIPIDLLNPSSVQEFRYQLKASRYIETGDTDTLRIELKDSNGKIQRRDFMLLYGKKPVALVNLGVSKISKLAMMAALDSLDLAYDTISYLPFDYQLYSSVFMILGNTVQGSHTITVNEAASLVGYLKNKGNLFMEGYSTWYYLNKTPLHPMFKYSSARVPAYFYPEVTGVAGTLSDSLAFDIASSVNYAVFNFVPISPAYATFFNQDSVAKALEIVYDGDDYKTIGTFLEFGGMNGISEPSSRKTLMGRYLGFFELNTTGPWPYFHAAQTTVCRNKALDFTDDSFDNIVSRSWEFEGGTPATSLEVNPSVLYAQPGKYDVKLTVSDGVHTKTMLKKDFIKVENCTGVDEHDPGTWFSIFPNPSSGLVNVSADSQVKGAATIVLFDLAGRKMKEIHHQFGQDRLPAIMQLSGYSKGMYFVRVQCGEWVGTKKLVVE